jgi:hypothetical protein
VILLPALIGLLLVVIFFLGQRRRDPTWERFRRRYRGSIRFRGPGELIDPNFQFDRPVDTPDGPPPRRGAIQVARSDCGGTDVA